MQVNNNPNKVFLFLIIYELYSDISRVSSKLKSTSLSKFVLIYSKNVSTVLYCTVLCTPTFHFSEVPDKTEFISLSLPGESMRRNVTCAVSGAFPRPRVRIKRSTVWGGMSVAHDVWSPDITDINYPQSGPQLLVRGCHFRLQGALLHDF